MTELALPERPPLSIEVAGETIKMTYGLEMDIRRLLPDASTALLLIQTDPYTQDYVTRRVLTPLNKIITDDADLIPTERVEITSDEVEKILAWATEHALYFFMKRATELAKLGVKYQTAQPAPFVDGSQNSASKTPSAGPLDASKETSTTSTGDTPAES